MNEDIFDGVRINNWIVWSLTPSFVLLLLLLICLFLDAFVPIISMGRLNLGIGALDWLVNSAFSVLLAAQIAGLGPFFIGLVKAVWSDEG